MWEELSVSRSKNSFKFTILKGRRCYRTPQLRGAGWKKWLKPKRSWRRRRSSASSATLQQISTALLAKCLSANIIETTIRQEQFHQTWLQWLCCCLLVVSFNWTEWIFRNSLHDTQDPITGQCFPFKVSNVEGMGRFVTFPNTLSIQTCASVHGTYHSAMTASNLCHMWHFMCIYKKSLYVIFTPCLSVALILVLMIWSFLTPKVQGSDSCERLWARRLYLPRKGTCGEKGQFQQQPCPEYPLSVQLCVDMEKTWILCPTTFVNRVYCLSRWVRVKQHLQSASAVDEECQERWDQKEKVKALKEASKIRKWKFSSFKVKQNQKVKMWKGNMLIIRSGVLAVPGQYVPSVVPSWNQRSNIQSFARS